MAGKPGVGAATSKSVDTVTEVEVIDSFVGFFGGLPFVGVVEAKRLAVVEAGVRRRWRVVRRLGGNGLVLLGDERDPWSCYFRMN